MAMLEVVVSRGRLACLAALLLLAACPGWRLGLAPGPVQAAEETAETAQSVKPVSYYNDIRPILQEHCQGCHQPAKPLGRLITTSYAGLLKGGESEMPAVVPGDPEESELLWQITSQDGQPPLMPKERPPLAAFQVELVRRWIAEGAKDDTPPMTQAAFDMQHPPAYTLPPVLTSLDFSPDGKLLAVSGYHEVLLLDGEAIATERPIEELIVARLVGLSERIESAMFSPDGKRLAVTGGSPGRFGEVQIWDVERRELEVSVPVTFDTVYGASWSPDGATVAFGCADNTLRAIDAKTGKRVLYQGAHNDWVLDTCFSSDGSHLVSVSRDRSMKLTVVETERFEDNITSITPGALKGGLISVDRHPQRDEVVVGGADGVPKLFRIFREKGKDRKIGDDFNLIRNFESMPGRVFAVEFNADGSRFVAGSSSNNRGEVRVYQTDDAKLVARCEGQSGPVYAVAFSPDGRLVASAGFDGKVRLNDAASGKLLREFVPVPVTTAVAGAGNGK